ncbi:MAG: magnesium chelatase domain-containing protein, partial [Chitinivibrionales bacterium]
CIVDSIQTLYLSTLDSSPGSVSQIRECTSILITKIKTLDTAVMLVAHINKDGNIAGPKIIEHMVDAVLYFEGEKNNDLRILRGIKNRYGPAGELAIFSMGESGLDQVRNASAFFIQMMGEDQKGAAAVPVIEGRRVLLVELQSLVNQTHFGLPVRVSNGIPQKRLSLIIAVIEKFTGIKLSDYDIYFNIAGGLSIAEPALELGVAASIISSFKNIPLKKDTAFIGELGLGGEIRPVSGMYKRVNEISKLGFKMCLGPEMSTKKHSSLNTEYRVCRRISELENILF